MKDELVSSIVTIVTAIIGVAILAIIVSNSANTVGVINAGSGGVNTLLKTAISPITTGNGLGQLGNFTGGGAGYTN